MDGTRFSPQGTKVSEEDRGLPGLPQGECLRSWLVQGAILRAIEEEEQEKDCREASADSSAQWFPALSV